MHASLNDVRILDSGCDPFPVAVTTGIFHVCRGRLLPFTFHCYWPWAVGHAQIELYMLFWIVHTMIVYLHMLHVSACINTKHMYLIKLDMLLIMAPWTPSMCQFPTLKLFDVEQTSNLTFVSPQFYWEKTTKARFNQSTFASSPVVPVPFAWDPAIQDTGPHLWKLSVANTCSIARFTWFQKHVYVSCVCKDRINLYIYVYPWKGNLPTTHTEGILGYRNHSLKNLPSLKPWKGHVLASEGLTSQVCCKLRHVLQKGILLKRSFS